MGLKEVEMSGEEKVVRAGRIPLEIPVGKKYRVALRGGGTYKTVDAKNFETQEVMVGVKLENAEIVVCNPEDPAELYAVSGNIAPRGTTYGRSIMAFLEKRDGAYWLKEGLLNAVGYIGKVEKESKKGYERKMEFVTWDPELDDNGDEAFLEGDLPPETVGAEQRGSMEVVSEEGEVEF